MGPGRMQVVLPSNKRRRSLHHRDVVGIVLACLIIAAALAIVIYYLAQPNYGVWRPPPPFPDAAVVDAIAMTHASTPAERDEIRARRLERAKGWCTTEPPQRVAAILDSFPEWSDGVIAAVACHRIHPGMSAPQLRSSWGPPVAVLPVRESAKPAESWIYPGKASVLLWGGIVRSWQ